MADLPGILVELVIESLFREPFFRARCVGRLPELWRLALLRVDGLCKERLRKAETVGVGRDEVGGAGRYGGGIWSGGVWEVY